MDGKIALEEHFGIEETLKQWDTAYAGWFEHWPEIRRNLLDITGQITGKDVRFLLADAGSPTLIEDTEDKRTLYVLMPMRV